MPKTLIFVSRKDTADHLMDVLMSEGYPTASLHGNMSQQSRTVAMERFRSGRSRVLVATDVAGRGLDVKDIENVINYDFPDVGGGVEDYVHRIGRTGRANNKGQAYTLLTNLNLKSEKRMEELEGVLMRSEQLVPPEIAQAAERSKRRNGSSGRSGGDHRYGSRGGGGRGGGFRGGGGGRGGGGRGEERGRFSQGRGHKNSRSSGNYLKEDSSSRSNNRYGNGDRGGPGRKFGGQDSGSGMGRYSRDGERDSRSNSRPPRSFNDYYGADAGGDGYAGDREFKSDSRRTKGGRSNSSRKVSRSTSTWDSDEYGGGGGSGDFELINRMGRTTGAPRKQALPGSSDENSKDYGGSNSSSSRSGGGSGGRRTVTTYADKIKELKSGGSPFVKVSTRQSSSKSYEVDYDGDSEAMPFPFKSSSASRVK